MVDAACVGQGDLMFGPPAELSTEMARREAEAKRVCARCPVKDPCLDYALEIRSPHGVWGGVGEAERRRRLRSTRVPYPTEMLGEEDLVAIEARLAQGATQRQVAAEMGINPNTISRALRRLP